MVSNFDLNLLRVFDAVMTEQHVSRAAEKLFISQSAVSHALTRLRHGVKDELFIKRPGGVSPTPRAIELWEPVKQALSLLENALTTDEFDPATSTHVFRIATHDYFSATLATKMLNHFESIAPNISIRIRPTEGKALELLDKQNVDFAISAYGVLPERFSSLSLFTDRYVTAMRKGHALSSEPLNLQSFVDAKHLLISPRGDERGFIDEKLAQLGMTRHVFSVINQFSNVGEIISSSDMIVTATERLLLKQQKQWDLHLTECPLPSPDSFNTTQVVWSTRFGHHNALKWFREELVQITEEF